MRQVSQGSGGACFGLGAMGGGLSASAQRGQAGPAWGRSLMQPPHRTLSTAALSTAASSTMALSTMAPSIVALSTAAPHSRQEFGSSVRRMCLSRFRQHPGMTPDILCKFMILKHFLLCLGGSWCELRRELRRELQMRAQAVDGNADRGCCTTQLWHNAAVAGTAMLDR